MLNTQRLFCFLAAGALSAALFAADPDTKIDKGLIATLTDSDDGTGAFFVLFGERSNLSQAQRISDWAARGRYVVDTLQATANRSQGGVRGYLQGRQINFTSFWVENSIFIPQGTLDLARELAKRPEVAAILPEKTYAVPPPGGSGTQSVGWNISLIGADLVWSATGKKGDGLVVANIDTGVQYTHPALVNQYRGNTGGVFTHAGNWHDPANVCGGAPCDNMGHGSHTMGTMVGDDGGTNQIGVAPSARWIACKGCESNSCSSSSLTACAQWAMAPGGDAAKRPHVVNNSWGGGSGNSWYRSYVQSWVAAGIFPAFSAGNSGPNCNTANSPGDYPESFASGATDSANNIASFSSRGASAFGVIKPELSAPGVSIRSSVPTNSYANYSGTSMASPHTAGAVALLWSIHGSYIGNIPATAALLKNNAVIRTTSEACGGTPAGSSPNNTYGAGILNVKNAVDAAGVAPNQPPSVTIGTPSADGIQFNCGLAVAFAATASDPENGAMTSGIQWSGPGSPAAGTGGSMSKTFDCASETGSRTVTAKVTDGGGLTTTDTVMVNIVNPATAPPAAPSGLSASVSGKTVTLRWTDNSTVEQGSRIYRRSKAGGGWSAWAPAGTVAADIVTYADTVTGGNYQYYVKAYNSYGESGPSGTVSVRVK